MTIRVNAFGKIIAFPADTPPEEIEKHINDNMHVINPTFANKAKRFGQEFAQNTLGINMGIEDRDSGVSGLIGSLNRGTRQTGRMIGASYDAYTNDLQGVEEYGENSRKAAKMETPEEQMKLLQELQQINREQSVVGQIGDTLGAAGQNKMGTAQLITEQIPNTAVSLGSGYAGFKTGAAAGALFGPAGAGVGGVLGFLGGMFLGNTLLETGAKAIEKSENGFTPDKRDESIKEGAIKGGVITGVDAVTLGLGGKVTGMLSRAAERAGARAEAKVLMDSGVDMTSIATINASLAANPALRSAAKLAGEKAALSSLSTARKTGIAGTGVALETVGEGAGEYLGEWAATGEPDVVDATIEALAGMSQSTIEAAYNYNKIGSRHDIKDVQLQATKINAERERLGLEKLANAGSVDEAINAAAETVSQKPVTPSDIWDDQAARNDLLMRAEQINQQQGVQNEAQVQGTETPAAETDVLGAKQAETILNQAVTNDELNSISSQAQLDKGGTESDVIAQNLGNTAKGGETEIILPDNTTLPAEWMVVDADSVKATMKNGVNQPRDRTRAAADVQIQQIANQPDYRRMSDSPVMDIGAPTLSSDGAIVGGNGRFEGVSRGYDAGTSAAYRAALEADAVTKGIDPATFAGMKKPVLVRRVTQPFDTQKLAVASNSGGSLEYSALERAKIDAERIGDIDQIDVTDSGDIALTKDNAANIRGALKGYSATELGSFVDNAGGLSQEGVRRLKNAVLYSAYGDSKTLSRMVESTDSDMRNIVGSLTRVAGQVAKVRSNIKAGGLPKELDVTDNLIEAVEKIGQIRSSGDTVDNYLTQGELFSDIALSEETKEIMTGLSDVMRSQKRMTEFLSATYDLIEKVDVTTENIFGDPDIPKKLEVIKHAKQQTAEQRPGSLFGEESGKESAAKVNNVTSAEAGAKYSRSPEERLKDRERSRKLERALQREGYDFRIQARDVRLGITPDGKGQEAIAAEQIARIFRKRISWIEAEGDFKINGVMVPSIPDTIFIDVNTNKAAHIVMGHELSHHMEQDVPEVYQAMVDALMPMIRDADAYRASRKLDDMKQENVIKEIVGDIVGDNFTDPEFWNKVAEYNPSAFRRIADTIISWIKRLVTNARMRGLGSEQWVTDAQRAQDIVARAVAQYTSSNETVSKDEKLKFALAIRRSKARSVNDFVIPETPEYADNYTGDLAYVPENDKIPVSPLRVEIGKATGAHQGRGLLHMADNARRDESRMPEKVTDDFAENLMRDALVVMKGVNSVHYDGDYAFVNPSSRMAVIAKYIDDGGYYAIRTVRPFIGGNKWGNSEWNGRLTFPSRETAVASPSETDHQNKLNPLSDRSGLDVFREKLTLSEKEGASQPKKPVVTVKKKRSVEPKFSSSERIPETIDIDGKERPTRNSNGKLIHPTEEGIRNFWKWFGNSKIVDDDGRPLVVYHGAPDARFVQQDGIFKGTNERFGRQSSGKDRVFWFAKSRSVAKTYADDRRAFDYQAADPGIIDAYLKLENPLVIDAKGKVWREAQQRGKTSDVIEQAQEEGRDGVIIKNVRDNYNDWEGGIRSTPTDTYVVFSSEQIKSATGNTGQFSPDSDDIRFSRSSGELDFDLPDQRGRKKDDLELTPQNFKAAGKTDPQSGVIGELNYDDIEQRPGTTEKQRDAGRNAYRDLLERMVNRGHGRLLGSSIPKDFREGRGASLIGQKVASSEDLAVLAQVLRDPRFETFRIFYIKDNTIVHHTGISSRMPGSSNVFRYQKGDSHLTAAARFLEAVRKHVKDLSADGYVFPTPVGMNR